MVITWRSRYFNKECNRLFEFKTCYSSRQKLFKSKFEFKLCSSITILQIFSLRKRTQLAVLIKELLQRIAAVLEYRVECQALQVQWHNTTVTKDYTGILSNVIRLLGKERIFSTTLFFNKCVIESSFWLW